MNVLFWGEFREKGEEEIEDKKSCNTRIVNKDERTQPKRYGSHDVKIKQEKHCAS